MDREEKVYFNDGQVKVTDLRLTAKHVTVPIERIEDFAVDFKTGTFAVAFALLLMSIMLIPALCYFYGCCGVCGFLLVLAWAVWLWMIYKTYVTLTIYTVTGRCAILDASMSNRNYVFEIEDALKSAVSEKRIE